MKIRGENRSVVVFLKTIYVVVYLVPIHVLDHILYPFVSRLSVVNEFRCKHRGETECRFMKLDAKSTYLLSNFIND